ncbi:MAG: KamA family radical SAM protein [Desulfobacterales bacterium]|jgi:lysine 2,3-aminomutase|nr:KamA family radical SAM protein [Desulfobacteraceae bacterium]MBT4364462.1 KamA family radical SAM protein [Desulfobacteraceae bacterium]MBT7085540.1 KamA family radical SAM protein [Desulfobacterales bacterium]MBT7695915.1 KamA family radical SAM protein [Desulfobacterales bacterium]
MNSNIKYSSDWQDILENSIEDSKELVSYFPIDVDEIDKVVMNFPMRINRYYLSLIKNIGDPIWRQSVPDIREIDNDIFLNDPLKEKMQSPVPNTIIHRYPDRVLFIVSNRCAMYCRFCLRKRNVGHDFDISGKLIDDGIKYIRKHKNISEVILSGGDPLLLEDDAINNLLSEIRRIPHIQVVRIHTRVLCTLPQRITKNLSEILKKYQPVYVNTHFNHPDEITQEASEACARLADVGIPLGCQTVLLKGINDSPEVIKKLMRKLLMIRVKPYYLHHIDPVKGTRHFRPPIKTGLDILEKLRGFISGTGVPQYMIDLPGGGGKVPLLPEYIKDCKNGKIQVKNYEGKMFEYPSD